MSNEILKRDQNFVTVLAGVTNDSDQDITMLRVDPISKRLLVSATGITTGVTSLNGLTGSVILVAGSNITITPSGNNLTIASTSTGTIGGSIAATQMAFGSGVNTITGTSNATLDASGNMTLKGTFNVIDGSTIVLQTPANTGDPILLDPTLSYPVLIGSDINNNFDTGGFGPVNFQVNGPMTVSDGYSYIYFNAAAVTSGFGDTAFALKDGSLTDLFSVNSYGDVYAENYTGLSISVTSNIISDANVVGNSLSTATTLGLSNGTGSDTNIVVNSSGNAVWASKALLGIPIFTDRYVTSVGNSGTSETDLISKSYAGNTIISQGSDRPIIIFHSAGTFVGSGISTQRLRAYFAGTLVFDSGALNIGGATNTWGLDIEVMPRDSSTVVVSAKLTSDSTLILAKEKTTVIGSMNWSSTIILKTTGTAAGTGAASNQVTSEMGWIQFVPTP